MGMDDWLRARFKPWHIALVAGVLLVAALLGAGQLGPDDYADEAAACRDAVTERLKSPSTAEFGEATTAKGDGKVLVAGVVDSENGFGANVRSDYRCETDGESARVVMLETR